MSQTNEETKRWLLVVFQVDICTEEGLFVENDVAQGKLPKELTLS